MFYICLRKLSILLCPCDVKSSVRRCSKDYPTVVDVSDSMSEGINLVSWTCKIRK